MKQYRWEETSRGRMIYYATDGTNARFSLHKQTWKAMFEYCDDKNIADSRRVINDALKEKLRNEGYLEVSD
jgi:hypothetical protein